MERPRERRKKKKSQSSRGEGRKRRERTECRLKSVGVRTVLGSPDPCFSGISVAHYTFQLSLLEVIDDVLGHRNSSRVYGWVFRLALAYLA